MRARMMGALRSSLGRALAGTFAAAMVGRVLVLVMAMLLGRQLGPEGYGVFVFALGLATLAGRLAPLGWPILISRLIPTYLEENRPDLIAGLTRRADLVVFGASALTGAGMWAFGVVMGLEEVTAAAMGLAGLITPFIALRRLRRRGMAATGAPAQGLMLDEVLAPAAVIALVLINPLDSALPALTIYALASAVAVVVATLVLHRRLPGSDTRLTRMREWWSIALPAVLGTSVKALMQGMDVLMIVPLSGLLQSGFYGASMRLTFIMTFPQVVVSTVMLPRMARAHAAGKQGQLRRLFALAFGMAVVTMTPVAAGLFFFPAFALDLVFGEAFAVRDAMLTVKWLAVSQLAAGFSIPISGLLLMCGKERPFALINWSGLALNVAGNFALIPLYGAAGAAAASAVTGVLLVLLQGWIAVGILRKPPPPSGMAAPDPVP